ncbi:TPA: DUF2971 domain-containing protein [Acinetobacter baumannii]|nr:DUF2971 domain-containing protein [Acinetobacter baumannii]
MLDNYSIFYTPEIENKFFELTQDEDFYYLYKHVRYAGDKNILGIFNNKVLKYTKPMDFNDPYDCDFEFKIDFTSFGRKTFENFCGSKISDNQWNEVKNTIIKDIVNSFSSNDIRYEFRSKFSVTCFNSNPLNMLMWSHYADNHKGFLLEFKYPKKDHGDLIFPQPLPVIYSRDFPTVEVKFSDLNMHTLDDDFKLQSLLIKKMILTKSDDWEYEKEFRAMNIHGNMLVPFPAEFLSSVVLGSNMPIEYRNDVKNSVNQFNINNNLDISVFEAKTVRGKFMINVDGHPRLDRFLNK